jgi:hypothetical protein
MKLKFMLAAFVAFLASAQAAFAQGCALCYSSASALGASGERSLDIGIVTLLVPALVLFLCVVFMLYRRAISATA